MNTKAVVSAIVAMSLTTGGFAFGQGYGDRNDRGRDEQGQRDSQQDRRDNGYRQQDRHDNGYRNRNRRDNEARQEERRGYQERARNDERWGNRGAGPYHSFHRGERLPVEYRHRNYVVDDWRGHNLSAPPRGYHWVQTGSDYVLIAIATGIIASLLLSN